MKVSTTNGTEGIEILSAVRTDCMSTRRQDTLDRFGKTHRA